MLKTLLKSLVVLITVAIIALAGFWFTRPSDISFQVLKSKVPNSQYSKFVEVDGVNLHYQEKGVGEPLILIHGYTSSTYTWKDVFEPLAGKYRVIAVDLKGFGFSAKPDGDYTRRAQAKLVAGLMDKLGIKNAWIAGNSMGGETAINIALNYPEKVTGLILIDSAGVKVAGKTSLAPSYLQIPVVGRLLTALALTSDNLVREGLKKSYFDASRVTEDSVIYYHAPLKTTGGQLAAIRARSQFNLLPVESKLETISVPTLIIWGAEDDIIPLEAGLRMNKLIKNSSLKILEKCGHVPQEEMPDKVKSLMESFMYKQREDVPS